MKKDLSIQDLLGDSPAPSAPVAVAPKPASGENMIVGGPYEGASRFDRNLALWSPPLSSADDTILDDKPTMDARARDILRNDAYVANGSTIRQDSIVGSMYLLNSKPALSVLGESFDEAWEEEWQQFVEQSFTLWAESVDNWVDASRRNTLTGLVRMAIAQHLQVGECLASVEWMKGRGRTFHTAIQMIDTDRLETPPGMTMDRMVRRGIRRDHFGAPLEYFIRMAHPTDWDDPKANEFRPVKARKPWGRQQIIHIFEQLRPDQTRGISSMVTAFKGLRMVKSFRDVVLQNAIVNATFAATIESEFKEQSLAELGFQTPEEFDESYLGGIAAWSDHAGNLKIDGVKVPVLYPGTKLTLQGAGKGGPMGGEFEASLLRGIAANLGLSYEQLSKDFSKANYSSARASMVETWKGMQSLKRAIADRFATFVFRLWLEEAIGEGLMDETLPAAARGGEFFYTNGHLNQMFDAIANCTWLGASRGQIDELKETQAAILRTRGQLTTSEDEMGKLGLDFRAVFKQQAREMKLREALGLPPLIAVEENSLNAASGSERDKEPVEEPEEGSEENAEARAEERHSELITALTRPVEPPVVNVEPVFNVTIPSGKKRTKVTKVGPRGEIEEFVSEDLDEDAD